MPFVQKRFTIIHNGITPQELLPRAEARKQLVPSSTAKIWIGVIAELHPIKGLDVLVEAFEHLASDFPDSELVIIGEGQERGKLERLMTVEGVTRRAHLLGRIENAATYMSAFDLFVLPSRSEGLPYVILEAGAARLPVVATKVGGIPEVIEDMKTGLLVPSDNRPLLTEAMERLLSDGSLSQTLAHALKETVYREFSMERMIEKTFALYPKYS